LFTLNKRQTINESPVYTISQNNEQPPKINDLFNLKVRVPKVKISKYFREKYSKDLSKRNVLKINDSQFLSNLNTDNEMSPLSKNNEYE